MKLTAISASRFNAGVRAKRAYGSSTATIFLIFAEPHVPGRGLYVESYGATPGARKTNALRVALPYFTGESAWVETQEYQVVGRIRAYPVTRSV